MVYGAPEALLASDAFSLFPTLSQAFFIQNANSAMISAAPGHLLGWQVIAMAANPWDGRAAR